MTRDEIIRMARLAGAMYDHMTWVERDLYPIFERFAALVADAERERMTAAAFAAAEKAVDVAIAAEREACAQMAEAFHRHQYDFTGDLELHEAIRARGE